MKTRTKAKILSGLLALSGLCMSGNAFACQNIDILSHFLKPCPFPPMPIIEKKPLTPEKKLELQKQKLELEYEADRLREEHKELEDESQKIKSALDDICYQLKCGTDFTNLYEKAILDRFDKCLEQRRMYREKLDAFHSRLGNWQNRAFEFNKEVLKYKNSDDLLIKEYSLW